MASGRATEKYQIRGRDERKKTFKLQAGTAATLAGKR